MKQRTLSIIKTDATRRNLIGKINAKLENAGLRIIAQKMIKLTKEQAEEFYAVHKEKVFYEPLVEYMLTDRVVAQVLEGENAIAKNREVMGKTNFVEAGVGTIRREFALSVRENCAHGSDSVENAENEIKFFFNDDEIFG